MCDATTRNGNQCKRFANIAATVETTDGVHIKTFAGLCGPHYRQAQANAVKIGYRWYTRKSDRGRA